VKNKKADQEQLKKVRYIVLGAIVVLLIIYLFTPSGKALYSTIKNIFSSQEQLQNYVKDYGILAPIIFIIIQIIQVIIAPIPGNITTLASGAIFGVFYGFIYGAIGIFIGSIIAYWLARFLGKPLVKKLIGKNTYDKYASTFMGRSFVVLLTVFLFPFFPDDALCLIAGVSNIKFGLFIILVIVGRSPSILLTSFIGAGVLQLQIWQWISIAVISIILIGLSFKYGDVVERYFKKLYKNL